MKKILFLLFSFLTFINVIYADPLYCYINKDKDENMILKSNDEINVYFKSNFEHYGLKDAKFQLYYDPYIFEIVSNNDKYINIDEGFKINNIKKYSSIIEFEVERVNQEIITYPSIYIKFKVKDDAKNGKTTIELIDNNSYVNQVYFTNSSDNEELMDTENYVKKECFNSKLYYEINNGSNDIKKDSHLTYIGIDGDSGFISPFFSPDVLNYDIHLYNSDNDRVYLQAICSIQDCGVDDYTIDEIKNNKKISLVSKNGEDETKYNLTLVVDDYEDYSYPSLTSLKVLHYDFLEKFDSWTNTYHLIVPQSVNDLSIDYESDFDVKIDGNENLQIGQNVIVISVSNENYTNKYYIVVQKEKEEIIVEEPVKEDKTDTKTIEKITDKKMPNIIVGLLLLITLILITVFIIKNKED